MFELRPMTERDIPAVLAIQAECYTAELQETATVVRSRLLAFAEQCWVAEDRQGVCGYLFGYLSKKGRITPLDGEFHVSDTPDCLYLHDLAVAGRAAGRRIGPALVECNLQQARIRQLPYSALVSVQDSEGFWAALGYSTVTELAPCQQQNLLSYQIAACYMVQHLS